MAELKWRQGWGIDPFREWGRRDLPGPAEGIVIIDLDNAIRRYGEAHGYPKQGDLILIEKKEMNGRMTGGEGYVYGWLDTAIATGEMGDYWRGCHVIRVTYTAEAIVCHECGAPKETAEEAYARFLSAKLQLDGKPITHAELKAWILGHTAEPIERGQ